MSCSLKEHQDAARNKLAEIFTETGTSKTENGFVTITPSPSSKTVKTTANALAWAKKKIEEANAWGKNKYGDKFDSGWAGIDKINSNNKRVVVKLGFPNMLKEAIEFKLKGEKSLINYNNMLLQKERSLGSEEIVSSKDTKIREKYFKTSQVTNSKAILDKISKSEHPLNELASHLMQYVKHNNVTIVLKPVEFFDMNKLGGKAEGVADTDNRSAAYYNPNTNTIHIAEFANHSKGVEATVLHEILHSITYTKLRDNSEVSKDFEKLYEYTRAKVGYKYALANKDEFIVALFTNGSFIKELQALPASKENKQYSNLFEEIFDRILNLIGLKKGDTLYQQAFANATHVLNDFKEMNDAMLESIQNERLLGSKVEDKTKVQPAFEQQYVFFKRRINRLSKELDGIDPSKSQYKILKQELDAAIERLNIATEEKDKSEYLAMANEYLDWVDNLIKTLPENPDKYTMANIADAFDILNSFSDFTGVRDRVSILRESLFPYISEHNLKTINKFNTSDKAITIEMIDDQDKDIRWLSKSFGSLSDVVNYVARTIGSLIKAAQNRASIRNKKAEAEVQSEVDALSEYAKSNGMTMEQVYDLFIQNSKSNTLVLTQRYNSDGDLNPNFDLINSTPELKRFYNFYQDKLKKAEAGLPYKVGKYYILNKNKSDFKSDLKRVIPIETVKMDGFSSNEELLIDAVPDMYRANIPSDKKSRDLGSGLLEFIAYANNHSELSNALPEARLLQEQLKYKQNESGNIVERTYIKSSDPKSRVSAENSNVYQMVKTIIDMQLKGKMTDNTLNPTKIIGTEVKDADGNIIEYKQIHTEQLIDKTLRLNSLLRIGLSPITAIANVIFGDVSNFIEAIGGKFFNVKEMNQATNIFFKQIDYVSKEKEGNIYKWLERLNPLQELADYDIGSGIRLESKKLTAEKAMEMMYSMQKKGELYLQSRTMIAMLIHDDYMDENGNDTGKTMTEEEELQMSDKIQRLNQQIHGRYSQREAATLQQSVLYRMAIQFRKWIPAAVESRFGDYKEWDNRLQSSVEGRYRSGVRNIFKAGSVSQAFENIFLPLLDSKKALEKENMTETEIYNMRKNMIEAILLFSTVLLYAGLKGGDDDDDKKRRKNPYVKLGLVMLNRIAGDLNFFYNPSNISNMASNAIPVSKLMKDLIHVGYTLPHALYLGDYKVKRGSLKEYNEFYSKSLPKIIPGIAPLGQIQRIFSEDVLPEL